MRAMESNKIREVSEGHETPASMPQFDMKEAVEVSLFHRNDIIKFISIRMIINGLILRQHEHHAAFDLISKLCCIFINIFGIQFFIYFVVE